MSLELQQLSVSYGARTVLHSVDCVALHPGRLIALVGANGAGKSSLLRAIAGMTPMQGQVLLDGEPLNRMRVAARARKVAYMPQSLPQASSLTVYESVLAALRIACPHMAHEETHARVAGVLQDLGLGALSMRRLDILSGGQRQMAGLAQLLVRQPRLLLLDEPTSALDLRWQLCLLDTLASHVALRETICLMAMHDLNLATRFCHEMLVMAAGRLIARGEPAVILTPELLKQTYGIVARVETCSLGAPIVIAEQALPHDSLD